MPWICCPSGKLCGADIDDVFAFEAPKLVQIREAKLGILYYVFVIAIVLYIVVWQIVLHNSYLDFKEPIPAVRLTLQQVTRNGCNPNRNDCEDVLPPLSSMPYCCNASCARQADGSCTCPWRAGRTYDCGFTDGLGAGVVNSRQVLIGTFIKEYEQVYNSSCRLAGCTKMWSTANTTQYLVAGIEDYTLGIDHSVTEPELGITELSKDMNGMLYVDQTGPMQQALCASRADARTQPVKGSPATGAPCYIEPDFLTSDNVDIYRLSTLLQAMGISLDPGGDVDQAIQYQGMTTTLQIKYFNVWDMVAGTLPVQYIYRLTPLLTPYKKSETAILNYPDRRLKRDVRGILFTTVTTGQLGKFLFQTLLVTLTTSLTLVAVATILVKQVAVYILQRRQYYRNLIYHVSADFSDVRDLEACSDADLHNMLTRLNLPHGGSREQWIMRILEDKGPVLEPLESKTKE